MAPKITRPFCAQLGKCLQQVTSGQATQLNAGCVVTQKQMVNLTIVNSTFKVFPAGALQSQVAAFSTSASRKSSVSQPPARLLQPLTVPNKILMGPGPSNAYPRVLAAGSLPLIGHLQTEFYEIMDDIKAGIQYLFQTENEWTFAISGTGMAAMEAAAVNLLEVGDVALVGVNGFWGARLAEIAERNGSVAQRIEKPMGQVLSLEEIEQGLKEHKPKIVFLTYGESSGGTAQPLKGVGELCHKYGALLMVDSVAIVGGPYTNSVFCDFPGIDVLYTGAQKVLGSPPSISPISFSQRARDKIASRKTKVRSFYFDAAELANYWGCDEGPRRYHHTGMISGNYTLREGLAEIAEKGLEKSWEQHSTCSQLLYDGLEKLGLELLVKDKSIRNPCVTVIKVPEGVDAKAVSDYAMDKHQTEIAGGFGYLAGKVWRIGVMGYNCTPERVDQTLAVLKEALDLHWKRN
ncbi:serine--pyruvate aminotransferase [Elysia marginata]|uniref:alanine--glyoxylate transaminase n=1 Tax=Elysia marginata TaxID=1093978 RepID=A0AAV4H837_9GAST|nr:serine--pyruvate aminotransferase [Elysia marginata]